MPVNDGSNIRLTPLQPMRLPDMAREASTLLTAMRRASGGGGEGKGARLFNPVTKRFEFIPGGSEKEREDNLKRLIASQLAGAFTDGKTDASKSINAKLKKFGESSVERQAQIIEDIRRNDIPALAQQTGIDGQLFTDGPLGNLVEQQKNNAKAVDKTGTFDIFWDSIRRGGRTFADGLADIFSDSQEQMARANARQEYFKELEAENAYLRNRTRRQEEGAGFLDRLSGGEVLASMGEFLGQNAPTLAATVAGGALGAGLAGAAGTSVRVGSILGQAIPGAITGAGGQVGAVGDTIMSDPNLTDAQKQQALADAKAPAALFGGALGAAVLPVGQMARRGLSNLRANMGRGSSNVAEVVRARRAAGAAERANGTLSPIPGGALTWEDALANARRADMLAENEIIRGGLGGRWRQQMADSMLEGMGFSGLGQIGTNAITGNDLTDNLGSAIAGGAFGGMLFTPFNRRTPYSDAQIPAERIAPEVLPAVAGPRQNREYWGTVQPDAPSGADWANWRDPWLLRDYRLPEGGAGTWQRSEAGTFGPEWGYRDFATNATDTFGQAPGSATYWNQGAWGGVRPDTSATSIIPDMLPPGGSDNVPSNVHSSGPVTPSGGPILPAGGAPAISRSADVVQRTHSGLPDVYMYPYYLTDHPEALDGSSRRGIGPRPDIPDVYTYPYSLTDHPEALGSGNRSIEQRIDLPDVYTYPYSLTDYPEAIGGSGRGISARNTNTTDIRNNSAFATTTKGLPAAQRRVTKDLYNDILSAGGLKLNSMPRAQYMEQARAYIDNVIRSLTLEEMTPLYGQLSRKTPKRLSKIRKALKDYAFSKLDQRFTELGRGETSDAPAGNTTPAVRSPEATASVGQNDTRGAEGIAPANNGNDSGSPANARSVVAPAPTTIAGSVDADGQPTQKRGDARTETQGAGEAEKTEGTPAAKTPAVGTANGERGPESAATADAKGSPRTGSDGSPRSTRTGDGRDATNARRDEQSGNVLGDGDGAIEDSVAVINRDLPGRSADDLETLDFFDQLLRGEAGVPAALVAPGTRLPVIKDIRLANRLDDRAISLDAGEVPAAGTALASIAAARQRALDDAANAPVRAAEGVPAVPVSEAQTAMTSRITTSTPEQLRGPLAEAGLLRQRGLRTNGRLDSAKVAEYLNDAAMRKAVANYVNDNGLASWGANDARVKAYDAFAKAYKMQGQPELEPYMRDTLDAYMSSPYPARKNMDDAVSMLKEGPTGAKQRLLELTDLGYCTITGR